MRILKILLIVVAAVVALVVLAVAVRIGSLSYHRSVAAREYAAQGLQMVQGCNGGAAVQADGQVTMIKQYLEDLTYPPVKDTNMVAQLQSALVVAQEKARVLDDDCRKRGHCESHPWSTNWVVVSQALTAFEKSNQ
jgi:hypothetical protein